MRLNDEWRDCWKWFSVQANTIGFAISSTYGLMYEQLKDTIPATYMACITGAVFVLGIFGRLTKQKKNDKRPTR